MLLGREAEQRVVDELLQTARGGRSAVLVFRGEAGIGKTTLLDYAERSAGDMTVLRCAGIQAGHTWDCWTGFPRRRRQRCEARSA